VSVICHSFTPSVFEDLRRISNNNHLNTIAFTNLTNKNPNNTFSGISFQNLILSDSHINSIIPIGVNPFENVKNESQMQGLTFLNSNLTGTKWSTVFNKFTNITNFYAEDCTLPKVDNFQNWYKIS